MQANVDIRENLGSEPWYLDSHDANGLTKFEHREER